VTVRDPDSPYPWCFVHLQGYESKPYVYLLGMILHIHMTKAGYLSVNTSAEMGKKFDQGFLLKPFFPNKQV
jgi:hypothetical protein